MIWKTFVLAGIIGLGGSVAHADTNTVRIALMPFAAPAGNPKLDNAADALPDLLAAALTRDKRFQLVEREKINSVWTEMHLTDAGLVSADTVAAAGKVLACDWLVNGSLVQTETGPKLWVKLTDTQSGVVMDLQALPFSFTNLPAVAASVADFLGGAKSRARPREFIALDRLEDRTDASVQLEDWTPRLRSLIEKHFLDAGYGVVERESVAPIFSEYQLESAGMKADASKRVKLKPAFWVVSGSWNWEAGQQNKISVTLQIRKMGGNTQMLSVTRLPGRDLETTLVDAIQGALKDTGSVTETQALAAEEKLRGEQLEKLLQGREGVHLPSRFDTNVTSIIVTNPRTGETREMTQDREFAAQREGHKVNTLTALQQAVLLNPRDMKAKFMLGMAQFGVTDPVESRHGEDLLKEVAASGEPMLAVNAKNWLDDVHSGKISLQHDPLYSATIVSKSSPTSVSKEHPMSPEEIAKVEMMGRLEASRPRFYAVTNLAIKSEHQLNDLENPYGIGGFQGHMTTCRAGWKNRIYAASDSTLKFYDCRQAPRSTFEDIKLPVKIDAPITAFTSDESDLWIGTDGEGLIKVPHSGAAPQIFNQADGFPMTSIRSLSSVRGRLFIGFGNNRDGAIGYLDRSTLKFTGLRPAANPKNQAGAIQEPPNSPVYDIITADEKNLWVASRDAVYQTDYDLAHWDMQLPRPGQPFRPQAGVHPISLNNHFVAVAVDSGGFAIHQISQDGWIHLNLSSNEIENCACTVMVDNSNFLWIGGWGKITAVDLNTHQIVKERRLAVAGPVERLFDSGGGTGILFIQSGTGFDSKYFELNFWTKPKP